MKTANYTHFRFLSTLRCDCGSGGQGVAIGLALVFFAGAFSAAAGDGSIGLLALLGVIVLLSGAVKIKKVFGGRATGKGDNTVAALDGILKPEIVLYPPTYKAIDVQFVQGSLVNRDHYEYYFTVKESCMEA